MKTYTVYKHTNRINKKVYIGMTEQNPKNRWKNGNYHSYRFKADIDKYGWESFDHEILFQTDNYDEACQKEKCLIIENDSTNPDKGYNYYII